MVPVSVRKLLHVDLSTRKWYVDELDEELYQRYLAGSGIAAKILYDELDVNVGATDPESAIIFVNG
ncbi:aldehyde ferredoxin oxidoreductase N-terminal domain-containing protein, partial [Candidatus Poribacteria bacterium]